MWDLIVSVPDHCLSFYFTYQMFCNTKRCKVAFNKRDIGKQNRPQSDAAEQGY